MNCPRACSQCTYALAFAHPGTEPERPDTDNRKLRWWEEIFGPPAPVLDMRWNIAWSVWSNWQAANNRHFHFMECRRFPETLTVSKTYFCGEYAPASVDRNPEGEDRNGLRAEHESAVPKADAKPLSPKDIQG